jgi:hypothetical protein
MIRFAGYWEIGNDEPFVLGRRRALRFIRHRHPKL